MQTLTVRVNEELGEQLRRLAAEEEESVSVIARRLLRRGVRTSGAASGDPESLARAHEGSGRVR